MWLHRRSEEPSKTDVLCYWKKSVLSSVGTSLKFITASELKTAQRTSVKEDVVIKPDFLQDFILEAAKNKVSSEIFKYFSPTEPVMRLGLHQMVIQFKKENPLEENVDVFLQFASQLMTENLCEEVCRQTIGQNSKKLWHEIRYGRITASVINEAAHCNTSEGSLVNKLLGVSKVKPTEAMERGIVLEKSVLNTIKTKLNLNIINENGIFLNKNNPIIGASPDGLTEDAVIEIKCPRHAKSINNYNKDNKITPKCDAQIQIQIYLCNKKKAIFVVADVNFENKNIVNYITVDYDATLTLNLIEKSEQFWKKYVYPLLLKSVNAK